MAQFYTDFSEHTAKQPPSGWTKRWEADSRNIVIQDDSYFRYPGGVTNEQALLIFSAQSGAHRFIATWDDVSAPPTVDVQARVLVEGSSMSDDGIWIGLRTGTVSGQPFGYLLSVRSDGWQILRLDQITGNRTVLASVSTTITANTWYRIRFEATGTTIRGKVWADGGSEPGSWGASASDSQIFNGLVGVGKYPQATEVWVDWIGVGTAGDAAPTEPPSTGPQTIEPIGIPSGETFGNTTLEIGGVEQVAVQVAAGADDWHIDNAFRGTFQFINLGLASNTNSRGGWRFDGVNVPQGAVIQAATFLRVIAGSDVASPPRVRLRAVAADDPDAPTTSTDHANLPTTTASVDWTPPEFVTNDPYDSASLAALLQEVVNRPGWVAGNAVIITFDQQTLSAPGSAIVRSYEFSSSLAAELHIEYALPPTGLNIRPEGIPSEEAFGTPTLDMGNVDVEPTGIASGEALGTPALDMALDVTPTGIASGEAFGDVTLELHLDLTPEGIASGEAFGTVTLVITGGPQSITPAGIPSGEAFGTPTIIAPEPQVIEVSGIPSGEAFGTVSISVEGIPDPLDPVTADLYTPPTYVIWLREADTLDAVQRLVWFQSLSFDLRDYQLGPFSFQVHNDHIDHEWLLNDGVIEVLRNGQQVYVGMVDGATLDEATGIWTVRGLDARDWFSRRDVWPPEDAEYDSVSGVSAGNAIIHYVENNFSAPADSDRDANGELGTNAQAQQVEWTVPASSSLGANVSYNARYINLLTLMFQVAKATNILFRVKLSITGSQLTLYNRYELELYEGTDRTEGQAGGMVFSVGIGPASRMTFGLNRRGHRNALRVLGQGEGRHRAAVDVVDADDVAAHFRREGNYDARNIATSATLTLSALPSNGETVTIGGRTYTFVTALSTADDVLIAGNARETLHSLVAAINAGEGEGIVYGAGTTPNEDVTAMVEDLVMVARLRGVRTAGVALSETLANGSWSAASIEIDALEEAGEGRIASLLAGTEHWSVTPDPIRAPWRSSWDLGDVVTVRSQYLPESAEKAITAVLVRFDRQAGETITIDVGDPPQTIGAKLAGKLGEINRVIVE